MPAPSPAPAMLREPSRSVYTRAADGLLHERFGLAFEAFEAGQVFVHRPGITFSQQDNVQEALATLNSAQVHYDEAYAATTAWRRPLMVSTLTLQRLVGMSWKTFGLARRRIETMHDVRMSRPVFAGDTLHARTEVLWTRHDDARLRLRTVATNQRGEEVASADYTCLMWRAHEGSGISPTPSSPPHVDEPRFASHEPAREHGAHGWAERFGLAFEDLHAGECFAHAPRRVVEPHEIAALARHAMEWSPQHHDPSWSQRLGQLHVAIPQPWLVGVATALTTLTFGRVSANLGWTEVRFLKDAEPGSVLHARSTITETRASRSRVDEGIVRVHTVLLDQHDAPLLDFQRALLVYRRAAPPVATDISPA